MAQPVRGRREPPSNGLKIILRPLINICNPTLTLILSLREGRGAFPSPGQVEGEGGDGVNVNTLRMVHAN